MSEGKSDLKALFISFVIILLAKVMLAGIYSEAEAKLMVGIPYGMTFLFQLRLCGEALLPNDLAVISSMFPYGYRRDL